MNTKLLLTALALGASACLINAQDQDAPRRPGGPRDGDGRGEFRGPPDGERGPGPRDGQGGPGGPGGPGGQRMRPPIMTALDVNNDGVIDEAEIKNSVTALKSLDKNSDGKLTMEEIMPPRSQGGPGGPGVGGPEGRRPGGGEGGEAPRRPRGEGQGGPAGEQPSRSQRPPQDQ